jgi:hypothetical protein
LQNALVSCAGRTHFAFEDRLGCHVWLRPEADGADIGIVAETAWGESRVDPDVPNSDGLAPRIGNALNPQLALPRHGG